MNLGLLWKGVLLLTLSSYSVLVVVVFFGGLKNIKSMLKDLKSGHTNEE
jgi:hypothetical protein